MRSSRVVRVSAWQPMSKLQLSWVRSQYPPTQWNPRDGRLSFIEYSAKKEKLNKSPPVIIQHSDTETILPISSTPCEFSVYLIKRFQELELKLACSGPVSEY